MGELYMTTLAAEKKMSSVVITGDDVEAQYENLTARLVVEAELVTQMVGGQPASEEGIRSFVKHHLKIEEPEKAELAVRQILTREVGPRDKRPPEGELEEVESYAVNVIRRTEHGPYIGDWMLKACIKQAASRIGLFKKKIGTKGDFAEGGRVNAVGNSLIDDPRKIYLYSLAGTTVATPLTPLTDLQKAAIAKHAPAKPAIYTAKTFYRKFHGKVSTPQGSMSIVHDSEVAPEGTRFAFEYRFMKGKTDEESITSMLALACNCGVGSAKSFECGKFKIVAARLDNI